MSGTLVLPNGAAPSNLHLSNGIRATEYDNDVLGICRQIKELSPDLRVYVLEQDDQFAFAIVEFCKDRVERLVMRVKELDGRVIKKLQHMMGVPLKQRFEEAERMEYKMQEEFKERQHEELYERIGRPMLTDLERTGFIQRPTSYRKSHRTGVKK